MLGEPDHVDPEFVGEPGLVQCLVDHDAVAFGIATIREQEIAEFHRPSSSSGTPAGISMRLCVAQGSPDDNGQEEIRPYPCALEERGPARKTKATSSAERPGAPGQVARLTLAGGGRTARTFKGRTQ